MAEYTILSDVSDALVRLLRTELCPVPVPSPEAVALASPADKNADYSLGLFLYDMKEQSEYRSSAPVRGADSLVSLPSKPLQLFYLLFLNGKAQIAAGAQLELRVLGRAMQTLMDHPFIDVMDLQPFLRERETGAAVTILSPTFDEKSKVWASLSVPYQMGVYFSVSPVQLSSRQFVEPTRVAEVQLETRQRPQRPSLERGNAP